MAGPVAWDLAERVAVRVAGTEPLAESYLAASLVADFDELTAKAELLVEEETGLRSLAGPARARVTDRAGWVHANVHSFQRLLRPVLDKLGDRVDRNVFSPVTRVVTGVELGTMLGWMATRVLGQYDLLLVESEHPEEQDIVYYVGPNILALEKRFAFPPREFRLWLALHEVTHRAQFTAIPWMRPHFLSLVEGALGGVQFEPGVLLEMVRRTIDELRSGRNPLDEGGLVAVLATPEQREVLDRIGGLMSLLEGHGDVTMDRAGKGLIPSAERFSRVLHERRASASAPARLLQKLVGIESKLRQYQDGERFIAAVEAEGGPALLARAWEGAELLPSKEEIRNPDRWVARITDAVAV